MSSTSTNNDSSSSTFRVNYSNYVADITGSPKSARKSSTTTTTTATGIGHHINPLHNPLSNRQNQPTQQTSGMPQYGGGSEKCARCLKTVYIAEKKVGAGRSFHTSCFSCYTCKRKLDSTGLSEHKGEIYCKSCYTRQFGAHGLISGVTMSTEHPVSRDNRNPRRSSYANDLDTPGTINQQTRQRTYSTENMIHTDYGVKRNDESPKKYSQYNDITPTKKNDGVNALIDTKYRRSPSPSRFDDTNAYNNRHRSTYMEEDDRSKYVHEGQKLSYGSGTAAMVDIPIVYTKRSNSTADRYEIPVEQRRDNQQNRSYSPSITSNDSYRRQNSRDQQNDFTNDYSRLNIREDTTTNNNNRLDRQYSNDNTINNIASQNPMTTRNFHHSSSTSSYETKYRNSTSNPSSFDRENYHSRESSPITITTRNRSPSPVTGYTTSTTSNTYRAGLSRDPSSPSAFVPQYDYRNSQTSSDSNFNTRHSSSPQQTTNRTSYGLKDFVSKTNLAGNVPSSDSNQVSSLTALVANIRQHHDTNTGYDYDN